MKISLQWLNKYVDLSDISIEEIENALPMIGLEVEETKTAGLIPLKNIVIGKILEFIPHPNSDHLSVCKVDVGDELIRQIVCGAKNFKQADIVPVALPGAVMPNGMEINETKMRGETSQGMMCSGRELGLNDDHAGLLILTNRNLTLGTPINECFPPADTVFDISITANRGDCLSHIGVARDLAAFFNKPLKNPIVGKQRLAPNGNGKNALLSVSIESKNCALYNAWTIQGVKIAPSPEWMQRDLFAVGLRPINNIVDITNWVMMELGSPLHAFDAQMISDNTIKIRQASNNEKIKLLDGKEYSLSEEMCVIADAEKPMVIAGIMGGENSGVTDSTQNIVLEAAWFNPASVRKTSRKLTISTDSSMRFTRDVDPTLVAIAGARAVELICELSGGKLEGEQISLGAFPRSDRTINISGDFVRARCGYNVADNAIIDIFTRLGFNVTKKENSQWEVLVPAFRPDVDRPIDLVEEFIRIYGTETIPATAIAAPTKQANDALTASFANSATELMVSKDFTECVHYTLRSEKEIAKCNSEKAAEALALANPLTSDQSHLRASLIPGLLDALKLNVSAHNSPRKLFEVGRVFRPDNKGNIREILSVAFIALQKPLERSWKNREELDFFFAKNICLEIASKAGIAEQRILFNPIDSKNAPIWQNGHSALGSDRARALTIEAGLINVKLALDWDIKDGIVAGEVLFLQEAFKEAKRTKFKNFSTFPPVSRDIALVVDKSMSAGDVIEKLKATASKATAKQFIVEKVNCFDVYQGAGLPEDKKSLAFEIVFRSETKTLTDDEVAKVFDKIILDIERAVKCTVRK